MYENKRSAIWKIPSEEFKAIVEEKNTLTEILNHFGLKMHGDNGKTLQERMIRENIDIESFKKKRIAKHNAHLNRIRGRFEGKSLEEILVKNSTYKKNSYLKFRLINAGLLKECCSECGLGPVWNGKRLSLHLEHKNGISNDNRLENLCLLCPNCHSQTETYCGKSKRKYYQCKNCGDSITKHSKSKLCVSCSNEKRGTNSRRVKNRPSRIELLELILHKPFTSIGRQYGVSDAAIRKWCKAYGLPCKSSEIKIRRDELLEELEKSKIHTITH